MMADCRLPIVDCKPSVIGPQLAVEAFTGNWGLKTENFGPFNRKSAMKKERPS
jgi:hypothetical protein